MATAVAHFHIGTLKRNFTTDNIINRNNNFNCVTSEDNTDQPFWIVGQVNLSIEKDCLLSFSVHTDISSIQNSTQIITFLSTYLIQLNY